MNMLSNTSSDRLVNGKTNSNEIFAKAEFKHSREVSSSDQSGRSSMDRASVFGTEGWGFESLRPGHVSLLATMAAPHSGVEHIYDFLSMGTGFCACVKQVLIVLKFSIQSEDGRGGVPCGT